MIFELQNVKKKSAFFIYTLQFCFKKRHLSFIGLLFILRNIPLGIKYL